MSKFIMSCTTCALRGNGDEVADTFQYAPAAGFNYWGTAGPALWTPFIAPWLDAGKMKAEAAKAGLKGCTEVYGPQIDTASEAAAGKSVKALVAQAEFAVRLACPLLVFSGGKREEGKGCIDFAGIVAVLRQHDYRGWIMVEDESPRAEVDPDTVTRSNGTYLERMAF